MPFTWFNIANRNKICRNYVTGPLTKRLQA